MPILNIVLAAEEAAGVAALRLVADSPHRLTMVLSGPGRGDGKERGVTVASVARDVGVPVAPARTVRDPALGEELRRLGVDVLLNVHSLHVVAPEVLAAPRVGCFNLHPGPLPGYGGLNVPSWAIYRGETRHGVTLHWMAAQVDAGPVAYETSFDLRPGDTGLSVSASCVRLGIPLVANLLDQLAADPGRVPSIAQDPRGRTVFGRDVPHDGWIPWSLPARRVVDFVRACDYGPWPSPWGRPRTVTGGVEITVGRAACTGEATTCPPGTVGAADGSGVRVAAGDEWVLVSRTRVGGATVAVTSALAPGSMLTAGTSARVVTAPR